jgi:hypothetical protein
VEVEPARPAQPGDPFLRRHRRIHGDRAIALSFLGFNPMKALVWSGIVLGWITVVAIFGAGGGLVVSWLP